MTALTSTGAVPTVGADADTWGGELNTEVQAQHADLQMLNTTGTNTILGRVTASTGEVERLTGAQAATILPAVVGDSGSGGTKGLVPAPAAGDAAAGKVLTAAGTWGFPEIKAWAVITGSTGAVVAGRNIACARSGAGIYAITFSSALSSANYAVVDGVQSADPDINRSVNTSGKTTAGFTFNVTTQDSGLGYDPAQIYIQVIG